MAAAAQIATASAAMRRLPMACSTSDLTAHLTSVPTAAVVSTATATAVSATAVPCTNTETGVRAKKTTHKGTNTAATAAAGSISSRSSFGKSFYLPKPAAVIGHRGLGSNPGPSALDTLEGYFAGGVRENTMLAFNTAAAQGADFIELDVQVTSDGVPVIWHDDFVHYKHLSSGDEVVTKRICDLTISEFKQLSYNATVSPKKSVVLLREFKGIEGFRPWVCRQEDQLPTLEEVLRDLPLPIGINLELKFEDEHTRVEEGEMRARIEAIAGCIATHVSPDRRIVLSSFSPDACILVSKMNLVYPVMFLSDAGCILYPDDRRNSIEAARQLAKNHALSGVVLLSNVLPNAEVLKDFSEDGLLFMSYGERNNDGDFSAEQLKLGFHSIIVDDVQQVHHHISARKMAAC